MESEPFNLIRQERQEIVNTFPLIRELFTFAQNGLPESNHQIYTDPSCRKDGQKALELPDTFAPLVADYPGKYFVVTYENRLGTHNAPGTRMRQVGLSTSQYRYESDQMLREIDIQEPAALEDKGNVIFLTVSSLVNEKSFTDINTAMNDEVDRPHGSAKITYKIDSNGNKEIRESHFARLDEALRPWKGEQTPVRWLRYLDIENFLEGVARVTYRDFYLIGKDEKGLTKEQVQVQTQVEKKENSSQTIVIEIGFGSGNSARTIFENLDQSIKVVEHSSEGMPAVTNQMEILKQDPNYSFLFENPVDQKKVLDFVRSRVNMLEHDWDKPHAVFGSNQIGNSSDELTALGIKF
jgi:hypothetical protein